MWRWPFRQKLDYEGCSVNEDAIVEVQQAGKKYAKRAQ